MAAWLTVRGRDFVGARQLEAFDTWSDKISWWDYRSHHESGDEEGRERIRKAAKTASTFRYDDLGLTLELLDTIKAQAIEMREADPTPVRVRRPAA